MTDLTALTTPYGLLDRETQEALKAHGGPYQVWDPSFARQWYILDGSPQWGDRFVYRVKPAPPKPREWWCLGRVMQDSYAEAETFRIECDRVNPGMNMLDIPIIHVREVLK